MSSIHVSSHHAMNTWWQVRISGEEELYASQAAHAAFAITDNMESLMSRFRDESEISAIAALPAGGRLQLSKAIFDCLALAVELQAGTDGAFDVNVSGRTPEGCAARWHLDHAAGSFVADSAPCRIDLGAIAKGFALDRMAEELELWGVGRFLLMSAGSSILAGDAPDGLDGWTARLGDGSNAFELSLRRQAIGTSGFDMQAAHIIDPSTGKAASRYRRSWAIAESAAEADALSTAWMNMEWDKVLLFCKKYGTVGAAVLDMENIMRSTPFPKTGSSWNLH